MTYDEHFAQEMQQKIEAGCLALGKRFYDANRGNAPEEYADLFAEIQAGEKALEDYAAEQRRMKELEEKGLILCPFCGEEIVNRSIFCNFCGKRLSDYNPTKEYVRESDAEEPVPEEPVPEEPEAKEPVTEAADAFSGAAVRVCGRCGFQTTDPDALFCNECGARLEETDAPAEAAAPTEKHCPHCGFRTTDSGVMFCIECGARMV